MRRFFSRRPFFKKKEPRTKINELVRALEVRVIDDEGNQLGVMPPYQALQMAKEQELDLVEIAPLAKPPVCKIMDFGKYQYKQSRQERTGKAKQKKVDIKSVRIGLKTDDHDLEVKKDQIEKFLQKGHKAKVEIVLRGREKAHQDLARRKLEDFLKSISVAYKFEQPIKRFPAGFNVIITP